MSQAPGPPEAIDLEQIGESLPLLEGLRTARAIRRLRPDPVPAGLIRKVCEAGTFAEYIAPALEAAKAPDFPEARHRNIRAALHLSEHMHEVPVQLFVAGWTRRGIDQPQSLFPCIQNLLLACRAVGLGASLTTVHRRFGDEIDAGSGSRLARRAWRSCPSAGPWAATADRRAVPWTRVSSGIATCRRRRAGKVRARERWPGRRRTRSSASRRGP